MLKIGYNKWNNLDEWIVKSDSEMQKQQCGDIKVILCCFDLNVLPNLEVYRQKHSILTNWYAQTHRFNFAQKHSPLSDIINAFFISNLISFVSNAAYALMYETWTRYCKHAARTHVQARDNKIKYPNKYFGILSLCSSSSFKSFFCRCFCVCNFPPLNPLSIRGVV